MNLSIDKEIYDFLNDLRLNNNREWFTANKKRYESARGKFEVFTENFIKLVSQLDASLADQKAKSCIYRIYRDVRFSRNKLPYKTDFCCAVARDGKNGRLPGFYVSIEPGNNFGGSGVYCVEKSDIDKIRNEICNFPEDIVSALENKKFKERMQLFDGEKLKKFPVGYNTDFHGSEYLKYKSWSSFAEYTDEECMARDFGDRLWEDMQTTWPLNEFLLRALEAPEEQKVEF